MPVLTWLGRVLGATFWFAVNLAVVTGLFFVSANLATQPDPDARNGALFFRAVAAIWLYIAAWTWVVRGVFQRPPPPARPETKPTGTELLKRMPGCLANLVPIPIIFIFVGRWVDWAWAGILSDDAGHPARQVADRALGGAGYALDHGAQWVPWVIAGLIFFSIASNIVAASRKQKKEAPHSAHVQGANEAMLRKLRDKRPRTPQAPSGARDRQILAPAGAASAAAVGAAHDGAHGGDASRVRPGKGREDRVLGELTYSSSDGGWWAHREEGTFPVKIAGGAEGPEPEALDIARQAIQRSFEVLLRASEAAQRSAQARGVGLPRFRISALEVGTGRPPAVTLHLRCDADRSHDYRVQSTDGLHTYTLG